MSRFLGENGNIPFFEEKKIWEPYVNRNGFAKSVVIFSQQWLQVESGTYMTCYLS
jgi:hypothetical protein